MRRFAARILKPSTIALGGLCFALTGSLHAVQPSFEAAQIFASELQQDFNQHHGQALIDRLNEEQLRLRVFSAYGDIKDNPGATAMWKKDIYPSLLEQMRELGGFKTMLVGRVMRNNGARELECWIFDDSGAFRMITLRLHATPDGTISINDVWTLGSALTFTQKMRQTLLILGFSSAVKLEPEEIEVESAGRGYQLSMQMAFEAISKGDYNAAYSSLYRASPELQATRVWQDIRNVLVIRGCQLAENSFDAEAAQGLLGRSPLLRFVRANAKGNSVGAEQALDDLLIETHDPPFLRAIKAERMIKAKQPAAALRLAQDVYRQNPFCVSGYAVAVMAACACNQADEALAAIKDWATVIPASVIDAQIQNTPELAKFGASPAYQAWKRVQEKPPAPVIPSPSK